LALLAEAAGGPEEVEVEQAWFEALVRWLLGHPAMRFRHSPRTAALRRFLAALDDPETGSGVADRIHRVWGHTSAVRFLAETGHSERTSLLSEAARRIGNHIFPRLDPHHDLSGLVDRLELSDEDATWIASVPPELLVPIGRLLRPSPRAIRTAAELVAVRAAAVGLSRDILLLQAVKSELDSPFFQLPRTVRAYVEAPPDDAKALAAAYAGWRLCCRDCLAALEVVDVALEKSGVSSDLVFRRELLDAQLLRIDRLLSIESGTIDGQAFAVKLVHQGVEQRSVRVLVRATLKRLARKVVEHTGYTGEHYLVRTRAEWSAILRAGAGAGALTAVTALAKYGIAVLPVAPAELGLLQAANYAASFLLMQALHLTLSSKQPAAMAAALAGALEEEQGVAGEVEMIAAITRCQTAATLANLALVFPVAVAIDWIWRLVSGHSPLSPETAAHTIATLDPVRSWTLPFAAITGVMLWASTMAGGWIANWSAYRRLPEAVAASPRVRQFLGRRNARRLSAILDRQLGGIATNVAIGFLLGFIPLAFAFIGLPIEVRHVTLSAGSFALAASGELARGGVAAAPLIWGIVGLLCIGTLNFGVAFYLSLRVAERARGLDRIERRAVWRAVWAAFRKQPGRFLWRPRPAPPGAAPVSVPSALQVGGREHVDGR
jgi:site-specific recombinase